MSSIASSIPASAYSSYQPTITVAKTSDPSLVRAAASLSEEAGIISSMGGSSSISQTSDAASLLNWFTQPFNATSLPLPSIGQGNASSSEQNGVDQQILSGQSSSSASSSGIYSSTGTVQSQSSSSTSEWTAMMKNNPTLAAAMNSEATNQSILSQMSAYA